MNLGTRGQAKDRNEAPQHGQDQGHIQRHSPGLAGEPLRFANPIEDQDSKHVANFDAINGESKLIRDPHYRRREGQERDILQLAHRQEERPMECQAT